MIKQFNLVSILLLTLLTNISLADELPHIVPTPDCPRGETCCPLEIYCSYSEGCGDADVWYIDGQLVKPFSGVKQITLSHISASLANNKNKTYWYYCEYDDIKLIDASYKLNGNWEYSGFGNDSAKCMSNNSLDCTAEKQLWKDVETLYIPKFSLVKEKA